MRSGFLRAILVLALALVVPAMVQARPVHYFPCQDCHRAGASVQSVTTNICLDCHDTTSGSVTLNDGNTASATGRFSAGDASNAFGNNPAPGMQTSHNWGAPDVNPAAGAKAPSNILFYGRQGYSRGVVACSRCHDPHGDKQQNPKLLKLPPDRINPGTGVNYVVDDMCLDCHANWNVSTHGRETHPIGVRLATATGNLPDANNDPADKYYDTPNNTQTANGNVTLNANGEVTCTSCHGVHWTDSDGSTPDTQGTVAQGDGKLLKHNGAAKETVTSSICQSCHKYTGHAPARSQNLGCLVCHSGHDYDPNGNPNIYMLRKQVTLDTTAIKASGSVNDTVTLDYTAYPPAANYDNGGGNGSLCLSCHDFPAGHQAGAQCADCHSHDNKNGSFAAGCGSCHGYAPSLNAPGNNNPGGYAVSTQNPTHDYSASTAFKDESKTPHATHANGGGNYSYACAVCHGNGAGQLGSTDHDAGTFQQVLDKAVGTLPNLTTDSGATTPTYDTTGAGTCSATYCHSNGDPRGGALQTVSVSWANGKGTIFTPGNTADNECQQCHGNDVASMSAKGNSATHLAHLNKGYTCNVCHVSTAQSANALTTGAIGGTHVNGAKDVTFDNGYNLGAGTLGAGTYAQNAGTCAVYCHSNGKAVNATPDWDLPATGACGACHQVKDTSTGQATGTGAPLGGAHARHVFDADGPKLACSYCHGSGADTGTHAGHVNGGIDAPAQSVCNGCHGAVALQTTGPDQEPVWTNPASVSCETCHTGSAIAVIQGKTAPDKTSATSTGHNKAGGNYAVSGNPAANQSCTGCHSAAPDSLHLNGTAGDTTRLPAGFTCDSCHGTSGTAANKGIVTHKGKACTNCHNPHGTSNIYMVRTTSAGNFNGTVTFTARTGVDSFDEDDSGDKTASSAGVESNADDLCATCHSAAAGTSHNNRDNSSVLHHQGEDCLNCHRQHTDPAGAFIVGVGDSCDSCHGFPPATGAHLQHAPDSAALDAAGKVYRDAVNGYADVTACAYCHANADKYTYDPSADQTAGYNHSNSVSRPAQMTGIGYDKATGTCSAACHSGASGKTVKWTDGTIGCDACHYQSATPTQAANSADANPLGGTHGVHFAAGAVCTDCHGAMPTDLSHITDRSGATELARVQGMAKALQDEATIDTVALNATDPDPGNPTCANTACHNPSGTTYSATWATSTPSCDLCHSSTDPGTGSHSQHMGAAAEFGINTIACTSCHVDNGTNYAHRDGSVTFAAGVTYTAGAQDVGGTVGTCSTSTCHNDGTAAANPVPTPTWGTVPADACAICHPAAPSSAKHPVHLARSNYVPTVTSGSRNLQCDNCHGTDPEQAPTHIDSSVTFGREVTDVDLGTAGNQLTPPAGWNGTCANNCHIGNTANDWSAGGALACTDCHTSGKNLDAGGDAWTAGDIPDGKHGTHAGVPAYGATGQTATGPGNTYDFGCGECHPKTAANHMNGPTVNDVEVTVVNWNGVTRTCGTNACHQDGKGGPPAFTPTWGTPFLTTEDRCAKCHGNAPNTGAHSAHSVGIHSNDVYNGTAGKLAPGSTEPSSHGGKMTDGSLTSTVINCQVCHFATVTDWNNDKKADCAVCHDGSTAGLKGDVSIAQRQNHVTGSTDDGKAEVTFVTAPIRSKAQLRNDIETVPEIGNNWKRMNDGIFQQLFYKGANSYDETEQPLSSGTFTPGATPSCTVACHNGYKATWTTPAGNCAACHKQLPR